jgi:hypothetical protein
MVFVGFMSLTGFMLFKLKQLLSLINSINQFLQDTRP